jgi:hypothetical protein
MKDKPEEIIGKLHEAEIVLVHCGRVADVGNEHWTETIPPQPHGLEAQIETVLIELVLDASHGQRKVDEHQYHKVDHFGQKMEVTKLGRGLAPLARLMGQDASGHPFDGAHLPAHAAA